MKKRLLLFMLCVAQIGFAQVKVNNAGIGKDPKSNARLRLYNSLAATDTIFGLHTVIENTLSTMNPTYGVYSTNANTGTNGALYGAYFKNKQSNPNLGRSYGVYSDNNCSAKNGTLYGIHSINTLN